MPNTNLENTNLDIRPELNRDRCFAPFEQPPLHAVWDNYKAPSNWINNLSKLIHKYVQDNAHPAEGIEKKLTEHLNSKYHSLAELTILLQRMYALLNNEISDPSIPFNLYADAQMLTIKLIEGISECTDGLHNRLNNIWITWVNSKYIDNFTNALQIIRSNLVQSVAINFSDDVHDQNDVSKIAAPIVNTTPINPKDKFHSKTWDPVESPKIITRNLLETFKKQYTPLLIIKGIEEQFFSYFNLIAAYTGRDETGLTTAIYEKVTTELNRIFPQQDDERYWLISNKHENKDTENGIERICTELNAEGLKTQIKEAKSQLNDLISKVSDQETTINQKRRTASAANKETTEKEKLRAAKLKQAEAITWAETNINQAREKFRAVSASIKKLHTEPIEKIYEIPDAEQRRATLDAVVDEIIAALITLDSAETLLTNVICFIPELIIFDLNWPLIRESIYSKLIKEKFFNLSVDLYNIPFDINNRAEFDYWAINLADQETLELKINEQTLVNKLSILHHLQDLFPKDHPLLAVIINNITKVNTEITTNPEAVVLS